MESPSSPSQVPATGVDPQSQVRAADVPDPETALFVRGLTRLYKNRAAVEQLDLQVKTGDVYGFLGPNGAGKTTAMRCILELIHRDSGEVRIFGYSDLTTARRYVGSIIEVPAFHEWLSGYHNLRLSCAYAGIPRTRIPAEVERVLDRVGLKDRAHDRAGAYSLGMKQRLGIARCLLGKPRLLMLDEPTNGLDPAGMREMRELIRSLALHDRITVFISSHLLAEVQAICNRVGIITKGKLRAEGEVGELLARYSAGRHVEVGAPDRGKLEAVLAEIPGIKVQGAGEAGRLLLALGDVAVQDVTRLLAEKGVYVDALVPVRTSLEDVFMEVTR